MSDLLQAEAARPASPAGVSSGWVPVEYMDEECPKPRASPNDWLIVGDVLRLDRPGWHDEEPLGRVIAEGETVAFEELTNFPDVRAVWSGPDVYKLLSPVPAGATLFCLPGDVDTLAFSIEEFMRDNGNACAFEPGEDLEIRAYDWSESSFVLRGGRFEPVEAPRG